jgi:hypothetical protein
VSLRWLSSWEAQAFRRETEVLAGVGQEEEDGEGACGGCGDVVSLGAVLVESASPHCRLKQRCGARDAADTWAPVDLCKPRRNTRQPMLLALRLDRLVGEMKDSASILRSDTAPPCFTRYHARRSGWLQQPAGESLSAEGVRGSAILAEFTVSDARLNQRDARLKRPCLATKPPTADGVQSRPPARAKLAILTSLCLLCRLCPCCVATVSALP